jgi:hypothetical protein
MAIFCFIGLAEREREREREREKKESGEVVTHTTSGGRKQETMLILRKHNRSEMVAVLGPYEALPYYIHTYMLILIAYFPLISTDRIENEKMRWRDGHQGGLYL